MLAYQYTIHGCKKQCIVLTYDQQNTEHVLTERERRRAFLIDAVSDSIKINTAINNEIKIKTTASSCGTLHTASRTCLRK